MPTCPDQSTYIDPSFDPDDVDVTVQEDGTVTITQSSGSTGETPVELWEHGDASPSLITWEISSIEGVVAFGISFGDSDLVFDDSGDTLNVYYVSDGQIVLDGVFHSNVPPLFAGDVLSMWFDPVNMAVAFFLNGVRVA